MTRFLLRFRFCAFLELTAASVTALCATVQEEKFSCSDTDCDERYLHGIVGRHAWVPGNMTWVAKAGVHGQSLAIHVRPVGIYWATELTREHRKFTFCAFYNIKHNENSKDSGAEPICTCCPG